MANAKRPENNAGNVTDIADARRQRENAQSVNDDSEVKPTAQKKVKKPGNRTFNHEKVAALKAAIANGTYRVDPQRVADKFIEQESP